ncbi:uncharacterized protein UDID_18114 [Ustilago sp. UG-2017a]|nr:uncharacterized protein UDID_18114 [Ustilago sp. UG-2017a]
MPKEKQEAEAAAAAGTWRRKSPTSDSGNSQLTSREADFIARSFLLRNSLSDATLLEPAGANQSNLHARWEPLFCWARFSIVVFIPDSDAAMFNDEILKALLNVSHSLLSPQLRRPRSFPTSDNGRQMEKDPDLVPSEWIMPSSQDGCVHVYVLAVLRNSMQASLLLSFSPTHPHLQPSYTKCKSFIRACTLCERLQTASEATGAGAERTTLTQTLPAFDHSNAPCHFIPVRDHEDVSNELHLTLAFCLHLGEHLFRQDASRTRWKRT